MENIKDWHKLTEVGIIPNDWDVKELNKISNIIMWQSPSSNFYNDKWLWLPLIQWNADIVWRKTVIRYYTSQITKVWKKWNIIMTVRAPVWNVAIANFDCCLWRGVCSISVKNKYIYFYLIKIENIWSKISTGSTFDSINSDVLNNFKIPLPPTIQEQEKIANVLSETDILIENIEKQIEKYENLKTWMMQNLLTWKIRLI